MSKGVTFGDKHLGYREGLVRHEKTRNTGLLSHMKTRKTRSTTLGWCTTCNSLAGQCFCYCNGTDWSLYPDKCPGCEQKHSDPHDTFCKVECCGRSISIASDPNCLICKEKSVSRSASVSR